jgi:hypothetical protein
LTDEVNCLTGSDDLELRQEAEKSNHNTVALLPLDAAVGAPALLAGKGMCHVSMGGEQILDCTHGGVVAETKAQRKGAPAEARRGLTARKALAN